MSGNGIAAFAVLVPGALISGTAVLWIGSRFLRTVAARNTILLLAMLASLVPIDGISTALYLRGVTGDLSIPSLLLLCVAPVSLLIGKPLVPEPDRRWFAVVFSAAALLLYPCALGLTAWDPYALGYRPALMGTLLFLLLTAAILRERYLIALALAAAPAAFSFGLLESRNLWDYLLDPCLAVYTLSAGARMALRAALTLPYTSIREEPSQ